MTKRKKRLCCFLTALLMTAVLLCCPLYAAAENKTSNRFNVVFVMDSSGSMNDTDPEGWRFTAVSLFMGLLAESGNYVSGVVFSDAILVNEPLSEITSLADKRALIDSLEQADVRGWTNTGSALAAGVEQFEHGGNPDLQNIIIYLTDGNTEMATPEETEQSLNDKAQAIQDARDRGIQIYSICLNANSVNSGTTNPQEMEQIAAATGGGFEEVKTSADLTAVFQRFYELIYSTVSKDIAGGTFDANGDFYCDFKVPAAGVEELNIITTADSGLTGMELTQPDGTVLSPAQVEQMSMRAGNYCITKITAPAGGDWKLHATGDPNAEIRISMIFNTNLSVRSEIKDAPAEYRLGETAVLKTVLMTDGTETSDARILEDYDIAVTVTDGNGTEQKLDVRAENGELLSDFPVTDYGTYTFGVTVAGNGISAAAEPVTIYVGNTPPVYTGAELKATAYLWPLFKPNCEIDLAGAATDQEDSTLTYSIVSSSFLDSSYELDGTVLRMLDFDMSKGSFTVRATDSMGASCEFEAYVTSVNMGLWFSVIVGTAIALFVIITAVRFYQINLRYFHGSFRVVAFTDEQGDIEETTAKPIRGRFRISGFGLNTDTGLLYPKLFFQATGKNTHTFLYSKKQKIYVMGSNVPSNVPGKKFRVNRNSEITVSIDQHFSRGLRIVFEPEE